MTPKTRIAVLPILAVLLMAAATLVDMTTQVYERVYTVGTLPAHRAGAVALVSDGTTAADCTSGSGSVQHECYDNGSTWTSLIPTGAPAVYGSGTITVPSGNAVIIGCTSTCAIPVPVPVAGYQICVKNIAGVSTVITLNALASSALYPKPDDSGYGNTSSTMVSTAAAGNKVCLIGRDATHYELGAINAVANWTTN